MKNKSKLIIMVGISGSGKSTVASKLSIEYNATIVETDKIREELTGDASDQTINAKVFFIAKDRVKSLIDSGSNVIFDATNLTPRDRREFVSIGKTKGCQVIAHVIEPKLSVARLRNSLRKRVVPSFVIEKQFNKFKMPTVDEGFDSVVVNIN